MIPDLKYQETHSPQKRINRNGEKCDVSESIFPEQRDEFSSPRVMMVGGKQLGKERKKDSMNSKDHFRQDR